MDAIEMAKRDMRAWSALPDVDLTHPKFQRVATAIENNDTEEIDKCVHRAWAYVEENWLKSEVNAARVLVGLPKYEHW